MIRVLGAAVLAAVAATVVGSAAAGATVGTQQSVERKAHVIEGTKTYYCGNNRPKCEADHARLSTDHNVGPIQQAPPQMSDPNRIYRPGYFYFNYTPK